MWVSCHWKVEDVVIVYGSKKWMNWVVYKCHSMFESGNGLKKCPDHILHEEKKTFELSCTWEK